MRSIVRASPCNCRGACYDAQASRDAQGDAACDPRSARAALRRRWAAGTLIIVSRLLPALVLLSVLAVACVEPDPPEIGTERHALIASDADRHIFVLASTDDLDELQGIIDKAPHDWPWVRIEVPSSAADGDPVSLDEPVTFDLGDDAVAVGFAQRYIDICNPRTHVPESCWITEDYLAGEEGLTGYVTIERPGGGLSISYHVEWEGITDRFDGDLQWYGITSGEQAVVPAGYVIEVEL